MAEGQSYPEYARDRIEKQAKPVSVYEECASRWSRSKLALDAAIDANNRAEKALSEARAEENEAWYALASASGRDVPPQPAAVGRIGR